jgi:hypothetical protein
LTFSVNFMPLPEEFRAINYPENEWFFHLRSDQSRQGTNNFSEKWQHSMERFQLLRIDRLVDILSFRINSYKGSADRPARSLPIHQTVADWDGQSWSGLSQSTALSVWDRHRNIGLEINDEIEGHFLNRLDDGEFQWYLNLHDIENLDE